jgi:hypothetical protein
MVQCSTVLPDCEVLSVPSDEHDGRVFRFLAWRTLESLLDVLDAKFELYRSRASAAAAVTTQAGR